MIRAGEWAKEHLTDMVGECVRIDTIGNIRYCVMRFNGQKDYRWVADTLLKPTDKFSDVTGALNV